jgi:ATP-dependent Clp protease adapter protein ClpS
MGFRDALLRIAEMFRPDPGIVFGPDTALLDLAEMVPAGFMHGVEILNDNTTPMHFVVHALGTCANLPKTEAVQAMLEIHSKGGMLLPTDTLERAQGIADALVAAASRHGHSLVCRAVSNRSPPNNAVERTQEL